MLGHTLTHRHTDTYAWCEVAWRERERRHCGCGNNKKKLMNNPSQTLQSFAGAAFPSCGFKYHPAKDRLLCNRMSWPPLASFVLPGYDTVPAVSARRDLTTEDTDAWPITTNKTSQNTAHSLTGGKVHFRFAVFRRHHAHTHTHADVNYTEYIQNDTLRLPTGWEYNSRGQTCSVSKLTLQVWLLALSARFFFFF